MERGKIVVKHVCSGEQRADILTKTMLTVKFERMRDLMGIRSLQSTESGV